MRGLRDLLRTSGFGILLGGTFLSAVGSFVHVAVTSWLIYKMTGSSAMVGILSVAQFAPMVALTLPAGMLADHRDKRRFLMESQAGMMVLAFALAVVVFTGHVTVFVLIAVTAGIGIGSALSGPTWMAYVSDIVPDDKALIGFSMNSVAYHTAATLGPPMGAVILRVFGAGTGYLINGISFMAILAALAVTKSTKRTGDAFPGIKQAVSEVYQFTKSSQRARRLLPVSSAIAIVAFGLPAILPGFAKLVLQGGEGSYGTLMGALGSGSLMGAVIMGVLSGRISRRAIIVSGGWSIAVGIAGLSVVKTMPLAMLSAAAMGAGQLMLLVTARTVIQMDAPKRLRGRVVSVWFIFALGLGPFGGLALGWAADRYGVIPTLQGLSIYAAVCATLLSLAAWSRFGRIDGSGDPGVSLADTVGAR